MKALTVSIWHWLTRRVLGIWAALRTRGFWSDAIVLLCGVLFLYSAGDKLRGHEAFRVQVGKSPILTGYEDTVAWAVPSIEIAIALMAVPLWLRRIGLYAFFALMLLFTGYVVLLLRDGSLVPCGCNALFEAMSLEAHVAMNLAFCALAATAVFLSPEPNLRFDREHPLCRDFLVPAGSRIRSMVARFKRKEAKGSER